MIPLLKLLIVAVFLVTMFLLAIRFRDRNKELTFEARPWGIGVAILMFVVMFGVLFSVGSVQPGHRGTVLQFGAVTDRTLGEGLYFLMPFKNKVEQMDVQTHAYKIPVGAASKDLQDVKTEVTLGYKLDPAKVNRVYQTLRRDYTERIIVPAVQEGVKSVTARFDAAELITKRPKVKAEIEDALRDRLAHDGIMLETISLTDFQFSHAFTQAIEAKQVAVQRAFQAENDLLRIEVEARQAKQSAEGRAFANIAEAEGQKKATVLRAEGEAKALLTVANAQAEANETVNKTLTDKVIQYALVQKLGDDIKVVILPSGQQFILGPEVLGAK